MPTARLHVDLALERGALVDPLERGALVDLPPAAARHVQVLRLQPGAALTLFDGRGGEWAAQVARVGRRDVQAQVLAHDAVERESAVEVTLALGVPANERMDALVEKATELGAAALQPLLAARSVLRLDGERAERRRSHWQAVAVAACEQCGRNRVPPVAAPATIGAWLAALPPPDAASARWLLGFTADAKPPAALPPARRVLLLSGPEGGLTPDEEAAARARGFVPVTLGARVLRADTAPLAALAWIALQPDAATR
ncbi:MAG: 16S rRNA (uracil(1498)-N(3))-methyltransferase [Burkholderiaceae bacterium]|nr:16S rRNA (uracil(1498)-N(3))-methyltransferase [Burkholderiaceae bacterium]